MVGVPRSSGCHLCVKRRIKCDQAKPGCSNCTKYGAACPGYDRGMKFVTVKHTVRPKPKADVARVEATKSPPALVVREDVNARMLLEPAENRALFINTIIQNIKAHGPAQELAVFDSWLAELPSWLGKKATLDSATCALVLHLLGKANNDAELVSTSRTLYVQSLGALQRALVHPREWKTTETLGAAMFLCVFELFSGTTAPNSWAAHAKGVAKLMEERGPEAHADGLGAVFFLSFRGIIIMNDLFAISEKGCFLASKRWRKVLRDDGRRLFTTERNLSQKFVDMIDDYFDMLVEMPQALKWGYMLREANRLGIPAPPDKVAFLDGYFSRLRGRFLEWFGRVQALEAPPREAPAADPGSIYETVLVYDKPWSGVFYLGFWANALILQESINQCRGGGPFDQSNREYMRSILRSIENLGTGMMGPYRVGFAVRIAYEFADVKTQNWIKMWLDRFSPTYAATAREDYPPTASNEYGFF